MRIAHILWSLTFGGIETMLVNIANAQQASGAKVCVIIVNDIYDEPLLKSLNSSIEVRLLHRKLHAKNPVFILRCNKALKRFNPDVIHLHDSRLYGIILSRRLRHETCVTLHDLPAGQISREGLLAKIFPAFNIFLPGNVGLIDKIPRVFAISDAVKESLQRKYEVSSTTINNGIVTSKFCVRPMRPVRLILRIVQVSRLVHDKKGQDLLIEAVGKLRGMFTVDFIGDGTSLDYLQKLTDQLGLNSFIRFLGKQPPTYIEKNLCQYDLFVQPSRYEGFGLTVAEAMAAQVPVLVSAGQGPSEVTCGNIYGWTFENGSVNDLSQVLAYIYNHYQEALFKAQNARKHVIDTYDVSVTSKRYLEEYKRI